MIPMVAKFYFAISIITFVMDKILFLHILAGANLYEVKDGENGILPASLSLFCSSMPKTLKKHTK